MPATQTPWEESVDEAMRDCIEAFGEGDDQVTYTHLGGSPYTLNGIFEAESIETDPDTGAQIISNNPQVAFRLSEMQAMPENGDTVTVRGVNYKVKEPILDGQGTVTCRLWRK